MCSVGIRSQFVIKFHRYQINYFGAFTKITLIGTNYSILVVSFKKKRKKLRGEVVYFFLGAFPLVRSVVPSPKIVETFKGSLRNYTVKEIHIGSAVSEII